MYINPNLVIDALLVPPAIIFTVMIGHFVVDIARDIIYWFKMHSKGGKE